MRDPAPVTIHLKDYTPPAFLIATVDLDVDLHEDYARVRARSRSGATLRRKTRARRSCSTATSSRSNRSRSTAGRSPPAEYALDAEHLTIPTVPDAFTLETVVRIEPRKNTKLMGLYASKDGFFTQCEAEGFRRITFFIDRPDVMARYTTTIHADNARYPGAALERQPGGERRRAVDGQASRAALGEVGRPVPEALVPLRDGRREARPARGHLRHALGQARRGSRSTSSPASSTRPASRCRRSRRR